ncbi:uncharacterized protein CC84DRAFT_1238216 [Paraphaeosphaeria sporulosa]|uniref:Uncharacterized protein n=1 Tax=Paraphaeosphaeria sporulosa TaxID=1460663 RepID=A0A177CUQ0_9PLEO|nr:uncharacterized protein CC84DRAFT_1238216 [Paraphaeosphaeria sporulosa]OAG10966.1 hypothetical protein CC84DRAFT_1238216 [Paraphaeosphaeria sporulosa]
MTEQAQDIICANVSAQLAYLHSFPLPSEEWYYGRIYRQGWVNPPDSIEAGPCRTVVAPFRDYEELVAAIDRAHELTTALHLSREEWTPGELERRRQLMEAIRS